MNYHEAWRQTERLIGVVPRETLVQVIPGTDHGWVIRVCEPGAAEAITLPDALSVRAYLDARRGSRTVSGAPDFGPGRV